MPISKAVNTAGGRFQRYQPVLDLLSNRKAGPKKMEEGARLIPVEELDHAIEGLLQANGRLKKELDKRLRASRSLVKLLRSINAFTNGRFDPIVNGNVIYVSQVVTLGDCASHLLAVISSVASRNWAFFRDRKESRNMEDPRRKIVTVLLTSSHAVSKVFDALTNFSGMSEGVHAKIGQKISKKAMREYLSGCTDYLEKDNDLLGDLTRKLTKAESELVLQNCDMCDMVQAGMVFQ